MNTHMTIDAPELRKSDPVAPALVVSGPASVAIRGGTTFAEIAFAVDTPVALPGEGLRVGGDYLVAVGADDGRPHIRAASGSADCGAADVLGGFHFAPGGNASARSGGDAVAAINPCSLWDRSFRPAAPDPRGMALVDMFDRRFWCDIYLLGVDHLTQGTSACGVTIADGRDPPGSPGGGSYGKLDYATAVAVMTHHGKGLLGVGEFFAAAYGVTERSASDRDPVRTGLDATRTSRFGIMQAAGNLWTWGHDEDPDLPRASLFGGSWWYGDVAGSRHAVVAYVWPEDSRVSIGARGRCDHLQPV
jgi:hypothetical protein